MDGSDATLMDTSPAASLRLVTLTQRADFQRASRAAFLARPGFVVQMRRRPPHETVAPDTLRIGFTCSKKVGNAVARNRAKRRLRELARLILPARGRPGHDYVLIGRKGTTATLPFGQLQTDFHHALDVLHGVKQRVRK